jgi:hypothetical protein
MRYPASDTAAGVSPEGHIRPPYGYRRVSVDRNRYALINFGVVNKKATKEIFLLSSFRRHDSFEQHTLNGLTLYACAEAPRNRRDELQMLLQRVLASVQPGNS